MSHYYSRGTIKQVKYEKEFPPQEEEEDFDVVFMTLEESLNTPKSDNTEISGIFGKYYNTCPFVRRSFNEDYFKPGYEE